MTKFLIKFLLVFILSVNLAIIMAAKAEPKDTINQKTVITDFASEGGVTFLLDNNGDVWGFRRPFTFEEPIKLLKLKNIKKLAPYLALDKDGYVYRWALANNTQSESADTILAAYSTPEKVIGLDDITDIAHKFRRDVVVKSGQEIWELNGISSKKGGAESDRHNPKRLIFKSQSIKAISIIEKDGTLILLKDGSVIGLGVNASGLIIKDAEKTQTQFEMPSEAIQARLNHTHTIVLSADGRVRYWGGCYFEGHDPNGRAAYSGTVMGVDGPVTEVSYFEVSENDNIIPDMFIKRDGTVWASYAPTLPGQDEQFCGEFPRLAPLQMRGLNTPVTKFIFTTLGDSEGILALGANHSLWIAGFPYLNAGFRTIKINLENKR